MGRAPDVCLGGTFKKIWIFGDVRRGLQQLVTYLLAATPAEGENTIADEKDLYPGLVFVADFINSRLGDQFSWRHEAV